MYNLAPDLSLMRETVRRFVDRSLHPLEADLEANDHIDPNIMRALRRQSVDLGIYAFNLPVECGGGGLGPMAEAVIAQEMGRTAFTLTDAIGYLPLSLTYAGESQRDWFLDPIVRGEKTVIYALTEPNAGSDLNHLETNAVRGPDGWVLNGAKQFISNVLSADFMIVLAVTNSEADLKGKFTTFILPQGCDGVTAEKPPRSMGWRGSTLSGFTLRDCHVSNENVLGDVGSGFKVMMASVNSARLRVAGRCIGMADMLRTLVINHARSRRTFGKRLADHQLIQAMVADIDVDIEAAQLLLFAVSSPSKESLTRGLRYRGQVVCNRNGMPGC